MSDLVIESARSSVILGSLAKAEVLDLSYEIEPSYPILSKFPRVISANNPTTIAAQAMNGQEITFNINKAMFLRDLYVRTTFTTTTTSLAVTFPVGMNIFEYIQIKTNNKVIHTLTGEAIRSWIENKPASVRAQASRMALPLVAATESVNATSTAASSTYTYIPASFFDQTKNNFDLNFYEQLSVTCKFNTVARAGMPTTTLAAADLYTWLWRPDDKYYDMMRSKNQNPSKPLNMLCWNSYTERLACVAATTTTMRLNCNYPVFKTVFRIKPITLALGGVEATITSFAFSVGGTELISTMLKTVSEWEKHKHGASSLVCTTNASTVTKSDNDGITIDWGMEPQNWVSNSGACSFSQLNYPQLLVNYPSLTAADYEVVVTHFYWNILTLDSQNGSVNVSSSS